MKKISLNPIRVAYLTSEDPFDKRSWSGTYYYAMNALKKEFDEVIAFGPVNSAANRVIMLALRCLNKICVKLFKKRYLYHFSQLSAWYNAKFFSEKLKNKKFDLIISPSQTDISKLKTKIPILFFHDATFRQWHNYYPYASGLTNFCVKESNKTERDAIRNSAVLIYSSDWAAQSAIKDFNADKNKVYVIPFGANIDRTPVLSGMDTKLSSDTCNLLFLGKDWGRKGGDIAVDTLKKLRGLKINARLIICGFGPKPEKHNNIEIIPFLDKNNLADYRRLEELMRSAHFLFLPTALRLFSVRPPLLDCL